MAEENIYKQEFAIRSLPTRSVTLYPARAHVIRDIDEIVLKPGANEITIYGLTPTADESSIKVDGKGSATITDMTVDLVTNSDIFEEVYPSETEESDVSNDDTSDSDTEPENVKAVTEKIKEMEDAVKDAREEQNSASGCLKILEQYGQSVAQTRPDNLSQCVDAYGSERKKAFASHKSSETKIEELGKELARLKIKKQKLSKASDKEKAKAAKARSKLWEKKRRIVYEKMEAKRRLQAEHIQFWPKKVYRVVLSLDTNTDLTPASSRRGSIDSVAKPVVSLEKASGSSEPDSASESGRISLSVSYITYSASWSPRYDLSLTTTNKTGLIIYRAEFYNSTSETWRDARVILSTSQTSFQGLGEPIPSLQPWHIRLEKNWGKFGDTGKGSIDQALFSRNEQEHKHKTQDLFANNPSQRRAELFGLNGHDHARTYQSAVKPLDYQTQLMLLEQQNKKRLLMARQEQQAQTQSSQTMPQTQGLFGNPQSYQPAPPPPGVFGSNAGMPMSFSSRNNANVALPNHANDSNPIEPITLEYSDEETATLATPPDPALTFQESSWEESGLTATYDVPGTRTIPPSPTTRRHKIASVSLKDVQLSYVLVPKLRTAAFLKARLRNSSSITLLRGTAGLTLDGTFLGNTTVPRCSAGDAFSLSLGVDPAVSVTYAKPQVRRSESGLFQKEGTAVYTRTITITNTKPHTAVEGLVYDQIPVSEDERLKVEILAPKGLSGAGEGNSVKAGAALVSASAVGGKGKKDGSAGGEWGTAKARVSKSGEVVWDVKIEGGKGVRLVLEYEARFPGGEGVVGASDAGSGEGTVRGGGFGGGLFGGGVKGGNHGMKFGVSNKKSGESDELPY